MCLDKNYCKILKFLISKKEYGCRSIYISIGCKIPLDDVDFLLEELKNNKYVGQLPNFNWKVLYYGKKYKKIYIEQQFLKYWFPILTATISYLLGLITNLIMK